MPLKLPATPKDPDAAAAVRYLSSNAAEKRPEIRSGRPAAGEGEDGVPFWRIVDGSPILYLRIGGALWRVALTRET